MHETYLDAADQTALRAFEPALHDAWGAGLPLETYRQILSERGRHPWMRRRVRTLVVAAEGLEAAVVVDGVLALEGFTEVDAAPDDTRCAPGCVAGLLAGRTGPVPLLDAARLLEALRPGSGPTSS